jgi:hypothetical protein
VGQGEVYASVTIPSDLHQCDLVYRSISFQIGQMSRVEVEYTGLRLYRTLHNPLARRYHPDHDARIKR